jgi:DNA (cytosine-5)-methyltransferase 1
MIIIDLGDEEMEQLDIFGFMYPKFKIERPIKLIEFFAGYGSQAFALKYLGIPFEHHRICEWAVPSIQAYKDAHFTNDNEDYSKYFTKEYLVEFLYNRGISMDYNEPMKLEQIKRMSENQLRTIYNNIYATHNLVNIQKTTGRDLEIIEQDKYTYMLTYSFPCQDLSLAGLGKGMSRDSGTRSGMLWEVERILDDCNSLRCLPKVLLMENVPQVIGEKNLSDFISWRGKLESLGYSNYVECLNAKDYGVPQNRQRCFMVSILGDYSYTFPKKKPLEKKLKDILENNVDEKYYLNDNMINYILDRTPIGTKETFANNLIGNDLVRNAGTITCRAGARGSDNYLIENMTQDEIDKNIYLKDKYLGTYNFSASDNFMHSRDRFSENKEVSATLLTQPKEAIVLKKDTPTNTTVPNTKVLLNDLRIRKLTPKECFRLMGVKDEDYENIAKNQSNSKLYHLAGDSIVVDVLMAIFKEMMG